MTHTTSIKGLEQFLYDHYKGSTAKSYLYAIERFCFNHHQHLRDILTQTEQYLAKEKTQGHSVAYRRTTLAGIKALYSFYTHIGKLEHNPIKALFISEKKKTGINTKQLLTIQEMTDLLTPKEERYTNLANRNKAIIELLIYQGLTSGELIGLSLNDVDLEKGTLDIKGSSKCNARGFKLDGSQMQSLIDYVEKDRPKLVKSNTDKLFVSMRGIPLTGDGLHSFVSRLSGNFHKEISPKNIRRSVISYWLNDKKLGVEVVQLMAGHRYPSSTEKYIRQDDQIGKDQLTALHDRIFS